LKKLILMIFFISANLLILFADKDVIKKADLLDKNGKHEEALKILINSYDEANPDLQIIKRIAMQTFEIAEKIKDKKDKINMYETGIKYSKPYININFGTKRDRAEVIHWYAINYASKMKLLGIFGGRESLKIVPTIFELMDECIKIDPSFSGSYLFKAKLYEEVPGFLGGDHFKMGIHYLLAIKYARENELMMMLIEAANGFYKRNWDLNKKIKESHKNKYSKYDDDLYLKVNDKEYAKSLLVKSIDIYDNLKSPSEREKNKYKEAKELLDKIKD